MCENKIELAKLMKLQESVLGLQMAEISNNNQIICKYFSLLLGQINFYWIMYL